MLNQTANQEPKPFGRLRSFVWPVYGHELKKLVPMFLLFFLIAFIYNLLRCMKLPLILKLDGSGAEAIPYLKMGAVLPSSVLFIYLYTKLMNRFSREHVFYIIIAIFLGFFLLFISVLYPNRDLMELKGFAEWVMDLPFYSQGFQGLLAVMRHWLFSVFYVFCEMWSAIVLSMLFWGFANEITKISEAKRFYGIFALGANASGIFSGQIAQFTKVETVIRWLPYDTPWEQTVLLQIIAVICLGLVIMGIFWWLNHYVVKKEEESEAIATDTVAANKRPKEKLSLRECFVYLTSSRYLSFIVIMVLAYNVVYHLADIMWTDRVHHFFTDPKELNMYVNNVTSVTGLVAVLFAIFVAGNVIRKFGWTITAIITPVIWLVASIGFFAALVFNMELVTLNPGTFFVDLIIAFLGNPIHLAILFGSLQICFGRASKYTVFDETKEIAFIPLSKYEQRKAKAVVDGLATRLGKSAGAVIYIVLMAICAGNIADTIPAIATIIFLSIICWLLAVKALGRMVESKVSGAHDIKRAGEVPVPTKQNPVTAS